MFPFIYLTCLVHVVIHIRYISIQQLIWLSFQPSFTHYQFFLIVEDYLVIASLTIINRWSVKYKGQIASKICIVYFIVLRMFILAIKNLKFYLKYLFQIKPLLNKHWKLKLGGLYTSFLTFMNLMKYKLQCKYANACRYIYLKQFQICFLEQYEDILIHKLCS